MKRRSWLVMTPILLALNLYGAHAVAASDSSKPRYAVLSLIGEKLNVVTYQPTVNSKLDRNIKQSADLPGAPFDVTALRTIQSTIKSGDSQAQVLLYKSPSTELFGDPWALFDGGKLKLPADLVEAMKKDGATHLVLVTRNRQSANLRVAQGTIGSGRLEGIGFYIDRTRKMHNTDTGEHSVGYLAPYVYLQLSLVDLSSGAILRQESITTSNTIGSAHNPKDGFDPWQVLSPEEKMSTLDRMIERELQANTFKFISGS